MADIVDKKTRSRMMAGIGPKNTKPEILIRKTLHSIGYRYRLHAKDLPGNPDIVLPKYKAVIFVHGCFWHGHDCHLFKLPQTRTAFWQNKIEKNTIRDNLVMNELLEQSWRVLIVWECALKGKNRLDIEQVIELINSWFASGSRSKEIRGKP